jgi:DnaJ-class molecular chaperone
VQNLGPNQTVQTVRVCNNCQGAGKSIDPANKCLECTDGIKYAHNDYIFDLPSKFVFGTTIRLPGKGLHRNPQSKKGDCFVQILPEESDFFSIDQDMNVVLTVTNYLHRGNIRH